MNALARLCLLAILGGVLTTAVAWQPVEQHSRPTNLNGIIRGQVNADGRPVANAVVRVKGSAQSVRSDSSGNFALPSSTGKPPLRVTASALGHLIAGADWTSSSPLSLTLRRYDPFDSTNYAWAPPCADPKHKQACGNCHTDIVREWDSSAHARSATNRRFLNVYDGTDWQGRPNVGWNLLAEYPHGAAVCYSCHVPSLDPGDSAIADLRQTAGLHREGIHCDFCHKVADVDLTHIGLSHGRFAMRHARPANGEEGQLFFGPLDDVDRGEDVYSPLYKESRYCASCHEGVLFGTHAYSTYSEWLESSFAAKGIQCQTCHMTPTGQMTNIAPGKGGIDRDPRTLASHSFPGGEAAFLRRHVQLSLVAERSENNIKAEIELSAPGVGHSFPTGHPSRNVILWLEALDATGQRLALATGPRLPSLVGQPSGESAGLEGQPGRFYAKTLAASDGSQPVPYWRPNRLAADTRLRPDEVDRQTFLFSSGSGQVTLTARLLYRRFTQFEADQKGWPDNEVLIAEKRVRLELQE